MSPALGSHPVVVMVVVLMVLCHPTEVVLDHGGHVALNPGHQVLHLCKAAVNERVNNCFVTVMIYGWLIQYVLFSMYLYCRAIEEGKVQVQ